MPLPVPHAFPLPAVIGHRGAAAHAPENTLASFRKAAELGAPWVELDVRLTADGGLAVIHDALLDRTTNGRGPVAKHSLARVAALDAGSWFAPAFADERVPTLARALDEIAALGLGVNVEIKTSPRRGRETGRAVAATLLAHPAPPPVLVSSYDPDALAGLGAAAPDVPRGLIARILTSDTLSVWAALDCASLHVHADACTRAALANCRAAGAPVAAFTVNDPERARELYALGVSSLFTDAPDLLLPVAPAAAA